MEDEVMTIEEVVPYLKLDEKRGRQQLATMRFNGTGPRFLKPAGTRVVRYLKSDIDDWLLRGAQTVTRTAA